MRRRRKRINRMFLLAFLICLMGVFNSHFKNMLIEKNSEQYSAEKLTPKKIEKNKVAEATFDYETVEPLTTTAVVEAQTKNKDLPVIGSISIPSVAINLPIFKGVNNVNLITGAGTMKADQEMGQRNYALASHRVQDGISLFSPLERIEKEESIYITDLASIYEYKVIDKEKISPHDIQWIKDQGDKKLITLITCSDMKATGRIVVQGKLISKTELKDASKELLDVFQIRRNQVEV